MTINFQGCWFTNHMFSPTAQNHFSTKIADNVFLTWDINGDYITMTATFFNNLGWAGIGSSLKFFLSPDCLMIKKI